LKILITGAAGEIGSSLRRGLRESFQSLRLVDVKPLHAEHASEEVMLADLFDMEQACRATAGINCVVHLAGIPRENTWEPILRNNVAALYNLLEASAQNGVRRIIFASSNHVIGFYRNDRDVYPDDPVRPDSRYGVSKVFGEALGRLYSDKHGLEFISLRIGSFRTQPREARELATWISPRDFTELVRCCIIAQSIHYAVLFGVSANSRNRWKDKAKKLVGFVPRDNGEDFAAEFSSIDATGGVATLFHGGKTCAAEFSGDIAKID
jgi:uronate dehydrogenase